MFLAPNNRKLFDDHPSRFSYIFIPHIVAKFPINLNERNIFDFSKTWFSI